jgi:hypothetical protein
VAIGLAALSLLFGGAAVGYVAWAPARDQDQIRCYTSPTLQGGDDDFLGTTAVQAIPSGGGPTKVSPIDICAMLWENGILRSGEKVVGAGPLLTNQPVPQLVACTLDNGIAAVFPGDAGTCERLGLPRLLEQ